MHSVTLLILFLCYCKAQLEVQSALLDPVWEDLVANEGMYLGGGRIKKFIANSHTEPNIQYQPCTLPSGKSGHCRHLRYCANNEFKKNSKKLVENICIIQDSSLGVCCPDEYSVSDTLLAGELPAIAPIDDHEVLLKMNVRAEKRACGMSTTAMAGRISSRSRIVDPHDWPWMALVSTPEREQHCGGTLITETHVLTAAHVTIGYTAKELEVRLGEYDYKRPDESRTYIFQVTEFRVHEFFEAQIYLNDIAILKLNKPAVFNTYVWPICLPPKGLKIENEMAVVTGWGSTQMGGPRSRVLLEAALPVWEQDKCVKSIVEPVPNTTICGGAIEGGKDACQGDSGGPLMYEMSNGRWVIIGVVSWGLGCGKKGQPGFYQRVDSYVDWIVENTQF